MRKVLHVETYRGFRFVVQESELGNIVTEAKIELDNGRVLWSLCGEMPKAMRKDIDCIIGMAASALARPLMVCPYDAEKEE